MNLYGEYKRQKKRHERKIELMGKHAEKKITPEEKKELLKLMNKKIIKGGNYGV